MAQSKVMEGNIPWEAYNSFFKLEKIMENGNLQVQCLLCIGSKTLNVSKSSPSNMKLHMERKHGCHMKTLLSKIEDIKRGKKRKIVEDEDGNASDANVPSCSKRQPLIAESFSSGFKSSSKEEVDQHLISWIIDSMHPFSEVERPSFTALWYKLTNRKLMSRKTLTGKIEEMACQNEKDVIEKLQTVDYVCTAADCWSGGRRSYLGVTCHFIDKDSLERRSVALACKRIKGKHTHDVIARELNNIFLNYRIQNKNVATITDNGSNFVKAFSVFGSTVPEEEEEEVNDEEGLIPLFSDDSYHYNLTLPNHRRCAAHTLNLVAVKDSENALHDDAKYKKIHRATFAKCQSLWNKSRQSSQVADLILEKLGRYLIVPNATRWNSIFDSIECLSNLLKKKECEIHCICDTLGLPRFIANEIQFMQEYVEVMKPLSKALDILQGEKNISVGYLLPTLTKLVERLDILFDKPLQVCAALVVSIKQGINRRFKEDFTSDELILAACFHPRFKFDWLINDSKKEQAKKKMLNALIKESPACQSIQETNQSDSSKCDEPSDEYDGFFDYKPKRHPTQLSAEEELDAFLRGDLDKFSTLGNFKRMKEVSLKLNTPIPSSASVERLFSFAKEIFGSKRLRLTDDNFENQLLLKFHSCKDKI